MTIGVNSTAMLLGAYGVIDRTNPFLLNAFFPMEQTFETEEVFFDQVDRARRLAPFVSPTVAGVAEKSRGYSTKSFKPAYVKPKHFIEPTKLMKRRAGEQLLGSSSLEERYNQALMDQIFIQDDQISRREEWMAAQLLLTGAMTVVGDQYPSMTVDLGRNAAHTVALSGGARWGQAGVDPFDNLRTWAATVQKNSGYHPSTVIMDAKAAGQFLTTGSVKTIMNTFRQTVGNLDLWGKVTGGGIGEEVKYLGSTPEFDFWSYQQLYTDAAGTSQQIMPDNTVIMGNRGGVQGTRLYGAIQDMEALRAVSRFPKMWRENDPSVAVLMTQSAPLPVLGWVDASFCATVA